uniref:Uncharacterized protein n=1 Tax=Heterorhabditis bacteriophora TaxID=37862 RepID=A0A1I7XTY9_HETBA
MVRMFLLDRSQPRFFTCCGCMHIKVALLLIILLTVFTEVIETLAYIVSDTTQVSSWWEFVVEIWEYVVTLTMIIALVWESSLMLIPFLGQMFIVLVLMLIFCFQIVFCVFAPYSTYAEQFFLDKKYSTWHREKMCEFCNSAKNSYNVGPKFLNCQCFSFRLSYFCSFKYKCKSLYILVLTVLAFVVTLTTMIAWCLNVGLACYQYFEDRNAERKTKANRPRIDQLPPLVQLPNVQPVLNREPVKSFPNPNYSVSDEEDEVFQKKVSAAEIV